MSEATGTNRIERIFGDLRAGSRKAVVPFVVGGHPHPGATSLILPAVERAGAAMCVVGLPDRDSMSASSTACEAMSRALSKGATPTSVLEEIRQIREWIKIGLIASVSVSVAYRLSKGPGAGGPGRFAQLLSNAGFDGVVYQDLPLEEAAEVLAASRDAGLACTLATTGSTPPKRADQIAALSTGFLYVSGRQGGHIRPVVRPGEPGGADAVVVCEPLLERLSEAGHRGTDPAEAAEAFVVALINGLDGRAAQQPMQQSA